MKTVSNSFYYLKILYKIRSFINTDLRIKLCESLVLSKLNYADVVIGPCLRARSKNLIQRVQNACARYCFNKPPRAHVTPYLNSAQLLKMERHRQLHLATVLFGVIKYECPPHLFSKLHWASDKQLSLTTRGSSFLAFKMCYGGDRCSHLA